MVRRHSRRAGLSALGYHALVGHPMRVAAITLGCGTLHLWGCSGPPSVWPGHLLHQGCFPWRCCTAHAPASGDTSCCGLMFGGCRGSAAFLARLLLVDRRGLVLMALLHLARSLKARHILQRSDACHVWYVVSPTLGGCALRTRTRTYTAGCGGGRLFAGRSCAGMVVLRQQAVLGWLAHQWCHLQ